MYDSKDYGRRLLTHVIDERAHNGYTTPYASIPREDGSNEVESYQDISYCQFANAINKCAYWIEDEIGRSQSCETLAYIGPQDLRYQILGMAAVKTGHAVGD